ncbi:hypothetical protein [Nitrosopumilus ureiphilus]|uniref:Nitrosopumilus output domain-containing protein n=1 Tax=Nitrosopumilus ureiphilus TaxID=1470067 RepID=A0A7D5R9Q7_9ARCH|nr:hypothetical protein [Nitrosopumilus ureiphilus]QLH05844.1 hypothetical protein C5F50_01175 [Nitrosopumilus ureiphilus]
MDESKKYQICRELVEVAVEHALIIMGHPEFQKVTAILGEHGITTADSLDHPDILKRVLCDLFGNAYKDIIDTIYSVIENEKDEKIIKDFLYVMEN